MLKKNVMATNGPTASGPQLHPFIPSTLPGRPGFKGIQHAVAVFGVHVQRFGVEHHGRPGAQQICGKGMSIVWRSCCVFGWHLGFSPFGFVFGTYILLTFLNDSAYVPSLIDSAC